MEEIHGDSAMEEDACLLDPKFRLFSEDFRYKKKTKTRHLASVP